MKNNFRGQFDLQVVDGRIFNEKSAAKSIVKTPDVNENRSPRGPIMFNVATAADDVTPWGFNVKARDAQLRSFWPTEPMLASAVYSMVTRLSVVDWEVIGSDPTKPKPRNTIMATESLLRNADYGQGWMSFITKLATDIYTQDNGGFIELVRQENNPTSPVIGINHLDSYRCYRTGDPQVPVLYQDTLGQYHKLNWWNVVVVTEMPSPIEDMYGVQYCAVTRALRAAQIIRDIDIYKKEKVSGQFMRTIHFVAGVTEDNIESALAFAKEQQLNLNLYRYVQPVIMPTLDPDTTLQHEQIDLATLPDNFDDETTRKWYVSQLALSFGVDYQEFAPLPSGNMGSGGQSEILHLKSRGKGPALLMSILENIINNFGIIARNVKFGFKIQDSRAEAERAAARFDRGKDRAARVAAGELDPEGARAIAVIDGDMPDYLVAEIDARQEKRRQEMADQQQAAMQGNQVNPRSPNTSGKPPVSMTDKQTQGGVTTQMRKSYSDDTMRAAAIRRLQRDNELRIGAEVMLTDSDIEHEKQRLRKYLKEMTPFGPVRRLGDVLESTIHQAFTVLADMFLERGLVNRDERIGLSALIGKALDLFGTGMDEGIRQRPLDIPNFYGDPSVEQGIPYTSPVDESY
jgi:hypothetical protein